MSYKTPKEQIVVSSPISLFFISESRVKVGSVYPKVRPYVRGEDGKIEYQIEIEDRVTRTGSGASKHHFLESKKARLPHQDHF